MSNNRKLLVGASSPIAYSYAKTKKFGRPAAVLECPIAYCLLYDEIWFLTRSICPPELEGLGFVNFVDEQFSIKLPFDDIPSKERTRLEGWDWDVWQNTVDNVTGNGRGFLCDNHAPQINIFGVSLMPSPGYNCNLFFDRFIASELGFELAENTPNSIISENIERSLFGSKVAQKLLAPRISSLQSPFDYWHPCLNELRSEPSLISMREKIASAEPDAVNGIIPAVEELDRQYRRVLRESLENRLAPVNFIKSTALILIGFINPIGQILGIADYAATIVAKIHDRKNHGWTRFICKVEDISEMNKNEDESKN